MQIICPTHSRVEIFFHMNQIKNNRVVMMMIETIVSTTFMLILSHLFMRCPYALYILH